MGKWMRFCSRFKQKKSKRDLYPIDFRRKINAKRSWRNLRWLHLRLPRPQPRNPSRTILGLRGQRQKEKVHWRQVLKRREKKERKKKLLKLWKDLQNRSSNLCRKSRKRRKKLQVSKHRLSYLPQWKK